MYSNQSRDARRRRLLELLSDLARNSLHHHHNVEEETLFPDIEQLAGKSGIMEANVEQPIALEAGVESFKSYVFERKPENYDDHRLKDIIDSFGKIAEQHLHEVPTLLSLHHLTAKKTFTDPHP